MMTCSRVLCSAPLEVCLFFAAVKAFDDNNGNCINCKKIDSVFFFFSLVGGRGGGGGGGDNLGVGPYP